MLEGGFDIVDIDRWLHLEWLTGLELKCDEAMDIVNKFWEYNIEILELPCKEGCNSRFYNENTTKGDIDGESKDRN